MNRKSKGIDRFSERNKKEKEKNEREGEMKWETLYYFTISFYILRKCFYATVNHDSVNVLHTGK